MSALTASEPVEAEETPRKDAGGSVRPARPRSRRVAYIVIAVAFVLAAGAFGAAYLLYSSKFVTTDNAQVDGDKVAIVAPATGTLTGWKLDQGVAVRRNEVVGRIQLFGSFARPLWDIRSPGTGTVAVTNSVEGEYVTAGTELATAYDPSKIYLTARVDETDVGDVRAGALVDVDVDAYPRARVLGEVSEVQNSSASAFSLFPEDNSSGNFQKVTQVVPVRISILNSGGVPLAPGMNIVVHIHKD